MKTLMLKLSGTFAAFALTIGTFTANAPCIWVYYQPKAPAKLKKQ